MKKQTRRLMAAVLSLVLGGTLWVAAGVPGVVAANEPEPYTAQDTADWPQKGILTAEGSYLYWGWDPETKTAALLGKREVGSTRPYGDLVIPEKLYLFVNGSDLEADVVEIGEGALAGAGAGDLALKSVTIPKTVTKIGKGAFEWNPQLERIHIDSGNPSYRVRDLFKALLTKDGGTLIFVCRNFPLNYRVPDTVTTIEDRALANMSELFNLELLEGVIHVGKEAFAYSERLESANLPEGLLTLGEQAFDSCKQLKSIVIPSTLQEIPTGAFASCTALENVEIKEGVEIIGKGAFSRCSKLKSINIPASVTEIKNGAFLECTGLASFSVAEGNPNFKAIDGVLFSKDGKELVSYPPNKEGAYDVPEGVVRIAYGAFYGASKLSAVRFPQSLESVDESSFAVCEALTEITLPEGTKRIGNYAFALCSSLESATLPKSLESIGDDVFIVKGASPALLTIYGWQGSVAETYAKENGHTFVAQTVPDAPKLDSPILVLLPYLGSVELPVKGADLEWSGGNDFVSLDENGKITSTKNSNKLGTATITAKNESGTVEFNVRVSPTFAQWLMIIFLFGWCWM
jgi:hypothetical protein